MLPYVKRMSEELRQARARKGMSISEVSQRLACSESTVMRLEQGDPKPGMLPYLSRVKRFLCR